MSQGASAKRRLIAVVIGIVLVGLGFWTWRSFRHSGNTSQILREVIPDSSLAGGRTPANVRGAVLYDCYEHARENVPPRNDTRARADHWQPPPMPAEILRSASAGQANSSDAELIEYLKSWQAGYREGKRLPGMERPRLTALLDQTRLPFEMLFNFGIAVGFLENPSVAAMFHRAALRRAAEEYKNLSPLHPAAPMLRAALPQMGMYWNSGDYALLQERFKIEMQLYPPLSQEGRKCAHSCAEAMYYSGRGPEAADLIATVMQRHEQAGDLTASDKQEMGWIVGIFYREDRLKESIAGLAVAAESGGSRASNAVQYMASRMSRFPPAQLEEQLAALEKTRMTPQQIEMVRTQATAMAARRPPIPSTRQALTIEQQLQIRRMREMAATQPSTRPATSLEQRLRELRATEMATSQPTTRPSVSLEQRMLERRARELGTTLPATRPTTQATLTPQQLALLAARRGQLATTRPATRPNTPPAGPAQQAYWEQQRRFFEEDRARQTLAGAQAQGLVDQLRALLKSNSRQAVDRMTRGDLQTLLIAARWAEVDELAIAAIIAASRDTWQVEQLQRYRVRAFISAGKPKEALAAAKALFCVAGMGSVPHDLDNITQALRMAYPADPAMPNRFRLQQLAGAQIDEAQRKKASAELAEDVMAGIEIDSAPFKEAIAQRQNANDYDMLYALGNLLLISGRISEAREVFEKVYRIAPAGEVNYASEAIAKVIKAEDGNIGRANEFVTAIRPKE